MTRVLTGRRYPFPEPAGYAVSSVVDECSKCLVTNPGRGFVRKAQSAWDLLSHIRRGLSVGRTIDGEDWSASVFGLFGVSPMGLVLFVAAVRMQERFFIVGIQVESANYFGNVAGFQRKTARGRRERAGI